MFYRKLLPLFLILLTINTRANIVVVKLLTAGIEYSNAVGGNAFVDIGDTVRFTWVSGTHNLQSTTLPSGVSAWSYTISSSNPTQDLVVNAVGWHEFNTSADMGRIICSDPNAPVRYYEFALRGFPASENIIAATSDPRIQHDVDSIMALPVVDRTWHIKGLVARGNDGHNKNWSWHFKKSRWRLVPFSEEVCDGWSSYVESHLVDMVDLGGYFCPWSSYPAREVFPTSIATTKTTEDLLIYPNPAKQKLHIRIGTTVQKVLLVDMLGKATALELAQDKTIDVSGFPTGMYVVVVQTNSSTVKTLVHIERE